MYENSLFYYFFTALAVGSILYVLYNAKLVWVNTSVVGNFIIGMYFFQINTCYKW